MAKVRSWAVRVPPLLLGMLFGLLGIRSLTNPDRAATFFGYAFPADGLGLSSLIGHSASWALTISVCLLLALIRKERSWYYPPMMLFGFFALGGSPRHSFTARRLIQSASFRSWFLLVCCTSQRGKLPIPAGKSAAGADSR